MYFVIPSMNLPFNIGLNWGRTGGLKLKPKMQSTTKLYSLEMFSGRLKNQKILTHFCWFVLLTYLSINWTSDIFAWKTKSWYNCFSVCFGYKTWHLNPNWWRCLAITSPSPPLLPGPANVKNKSRCGRNVLYKKTTWTWRLGKG